jgi:hypothetical protein
MLESNHPVHPLDPLVMTKSLSTTHDPNANDHEEHVHHLPNPYFWDLDSLQSNNDSN